MYLEKGVQVTLLMASFWAAYMEVCSLGLFVGLKKDLHNERFKNYQKQHDDKIKLEMIITGARLHKIHILHIKKQFVNLLQKNKKENLNKKELKRLRKLEIQKMKLQTCLALKSVKHMHKINLEMQKFFCIFLNNVAISTNLAEK